MKEQLRGYADELFRIKGQHPLVAKNVTTA